MEKSQLFGILLVLVILGGGGYFVLQKDSAVLDDLLPADDEEERSIATGTELSSSKAHSSEQDVQTLENEPETIVSKVENIVGIKQPAYYKWVDAKGTIHYTDDPTTVPENYRDQITKLNLGSGGRGGVLVQQNSCDQPQEKSSLFNMAIGGSESPSRTKLPSLNQSAAPRKTSPMGSGGDILKVFTRGGDNKSQQLLNFLRKMNVPHVNLDVGENQQLHEQMKNLTQGQDTLPVSVFPENKVMTGFNRQALLQAIQNLDGVSPGSAK